MKYVSGLSLIIQATIKIGVNGGNCVGELKIIIIIYLTANGLSPGGSGYNACTQI